MVKSSHMSSCTQKMVTIDSVTSFHLMYLLHCLQCFDAVGWAAGRASGL